MVQGSSKPADQASNSTTPARTLTTNQIEAAQFKRARIFAGFPGVGKSFVTNNPPPGLKFIDSDSAEFSKLEDGRTPNPAWPGNYIDHIKSESRKADVIFVSTHETTRQLLEENGLKYTLVYPDKDLKQEYMERYKRRGSPDFLIKILDNNWEKFVEQCSQQKNCDHVVLDAGEHMDDVMIRTGIAAVHPSTK